MTKQDDDLKEEVKQILFGLLRSIDRSKENFDYLASDVEIAVGNLNNMLCDGDVEIQNCKLAAGFGIRIPPKGFGTEKLGIEALAKISKMYFGEDFKRPTNNFPKRIFKRGFSPEANAVDVWYATVTFVDRDAGYYFVEWDRSPKFCCTRVRIDVVKKEDDGQQGYFVATC